MIEISVDCHAGYRGEERPVRLHFDDRSIGVEEVLDQWLALDHRYFKVIGEDRDLYILRHDTEEDRWELILYQREGFSNSSVSRSG